MKRIVHAILLSLFIFICVNFIYSNMTPETLDYPMVFRFRLPWLLTLISKPIPLGFILILSFSLGIVFLSCLQALPELFRYKDHKAQEKRIKELEAEVARYQQSGSTLSATSTKSDSL